MEITRKPTTDELKDFTPINQPNAHDSFIIRLHKAGQEAMKKSLPFAEKPCLDEWKDHYEGEKKRIVRQFGFMKESEVQTLKIDWDKFSDVKNFKIVEEGEKHDESLSDRLKKQVFLKFKIYKFKGYSNTYNIMEPYHNAWKSI